MAYDLTGQEIVDLTSNNLGGMANAVTPDQLLQFINEGKDELWGVMKQLNKGFFVVQSQATSPTASYYFAPLNTTTREYALPFDLVDIEFIEVIAPVGYETTRFTRVPVFHNAFRSARTSALAFQDQGGSIPFTGNSEYLYDIIGKGTLTLAQFPEVAFTLKIWYVRTLPEITLQGAVDEVIFPFHKKIADYAAMRVFLKGKPDSFAEYQGVWREDVIQVMQSASRESSDPQFAEDFLG